MKGLKLYVQPQVSFGELYVANSIFVGAVFLGVGSNIGATFYLVSVRLIFLHLSSQGSLTLK